MNKYLSAFVIIISCLLFVPSVVLAHTGEENKQSSYKVVVTQDPLSPFVGEKVSVTFALEDEQGKPVSGINGNFIINKQIVKAYVEKDAEIGNEVVHQESGMTDETGSATVTYTFPAEGHYDIEYVWGTFEGENAGHEIFARDPTSYFVPQELMKRIWLFMGIAFAGMVVGAVAMFIILTTTLHPKK